MIAKPGCHHGLFPDTPSGQLIQNGCIKDIASNPSKLCMITYFNQHSRQEQMHSHFVLDRTSELLLTLQHLTLSMKTLDYLGIPLAAAYIDMAINKVKEEVEPDQQPQWIALDRELDFSSLDRMIDSVFLVAR